ncbi:MAG: bifunctional aldolase/short-chain dehydrogenase [Candidatus Omnitrophica bacterium]|nr:bifunctional aldolase/short-chain dehydrogenase [Candidatus Omnitrophota bacterium]
MNSLWKDSEAKNFGLDDLGQRVYTSQLLGREPSLVLHGGGNTSVKSSVKNILGDRDYVLYVKGSGWDLATIKREGFAPVRMDALIKMAGLDELDDTQMVREQRTALTDPYAPNPSVEAILHAIIPFKFVDHTHADAVVTLTNTPNGEQLIKEIYGPNVLIVPYVMPGFILAKEIYRMTRSLNWSKCEGMILLHHGVFSFDQDARKSYEKMLKLVSKSENYIQRHVKKVAYTKKESPVDLVKLANLRRCVSQQRGCSVLVKLDHSVEQRQFSDCPDVRIISQKGPLTPDHIIRTKRIPVVISTDEQKDIEKFTDEYKKYFKKYGHAQLKCLDTAPRWGIWPSVGTLAFGTSLEEVRIIEDIKRHTTKAISNAESLGGWRALSPKDLFDMEYWVLEQAKLSKSSKSPLFQGKIVLVTGAASGIGRACVEQFVQEGAVVAALDIDLHLKTVFNRREILNLVVDVTDELALQKAIEETVLTFGGLDIIVSNAGIFPASERINQLNKKTWDKSLDVNLSSHQWLIKHSIKFLEKGIDPTIIIIASKNVAAPGPGVSAYSVPKAGLTQLARVAALELAADKIRVNVVHPNAVFDTAIWTDEVLNKRAKSYGITVEEYKTNNLLKTEITSRDVARLVTTMAGPVFSKTTGAQIPIDGGNERVI